MRQPRLTLARQYLVLQFLIVLVVLFAVGAMTLTQEARAIERTEGRRALGAAENLAKQGLVRDRVEVAEPRGDAALAAAAETTRLVSNSSMVAVARLDGKVLVSSNPALVGQALPFDQHGAEAGRSWSGLVDVEGISMVAALVPILNGQTGDIIGVVAIGRKYPSRWERLTAAAPNLLTYLGVASVLGLLGSWTLARLVKRQTLGMEPTEIAALVEHREALVHGVKEGVIALDQQQRITVVNDSARELLGLPADCVGHELSQCGLNARSYEILTQGEAGPDRLAIVGGRVLAFNRMPLTLRGDTIGTVTTMRDRTELSSLEEELGTTRATTDTLRAQTHEFANQLHVISGLLHLEQYAEVQHFVHGVRATRTRIYDDVTARIEDPSVAALIIAKTSLAAERTIELELDESSRVGPLSDAVSRDLTTIVGNLVDNAFDALDSVATGTARRVTVAIHEVDDEIRAVVRDSGPGVAPVCQAQVFRQGFSTKPAAGGGRGFGLALTRAICRRRGGDVTVHNDHGAVFTAVLQQKEVTTG